MRCDTCKHLWSLAPQPSSPYGEYACMKHGCDLNGATEDDVKDCEHFEAKEAKV